MKNDIVGMNDIQRMVDTFYGKIRKDDLLKDIFENIIKDNWDAHLGKMYRFWQTVILGEHTYYGSPFAPHGNMPVTKIHFDRWIEIFIENIDERFSGVNAEDTKKRAVSMAKLFNSKLEYYRQNNNKPIL